METWRALAAANNAEWCDLVCRSHGIVTRFDQDAWTSPTRTPAYYPDAVTLSPRSSIDDLLSRIDGSPGCSIKDSFAALDVTGHGFQVLLEAEWIVRPCTVPSKVKMELRWDLVRDAAAFAGWHDAWRGEEGPTDVFVPSLLDEGSIVFLAAHLDGRVVAGAVLSRSSAVVGLSNYFSHPSVDQHSTWSGCIRAAASMCDALPLVGYESGKRLEAALAEGFERAGPLRVWMRPA